MKQYLTIQMTIELLEDLENQSGRWVQIQCNANNPLPLAKEYPDQFENVVWHCIREGYVRPRDVVYESWLKRFINSRLPPYIPNDAVDALHVGIELMIVPRGTLRLHQIRKEFATEE